jgi:hypothetical protein
MTVGQPQFSDLPDLPEDLPPVPGDLPDSPINLAAVPADPPPSAFSAPVAADPTAEPMSGAAIWAAMTDWLKNNVVTAALFACVGALLAFLANLALLLFGPGLPFGSAAANPGNIATAGFCWMLGITVLGALGGYWWSAGTEKFFEAVRLFPASIASLFRAGGGSARLHLLWGAGIALLVSVLISPAIGAVVAVAFIVSLPSLFGGFVSNLLFRLWSTLVALVSPTKRYPLDGAIMMAVGLMGAVLALGVGSLLPTATLKLLLAGACVGLALLMRPQRGIARSYLLPAAFIAAGACSLFFPVASAQTPEILSGRTPPALSPRGSCDDGKLRHIEQSAAKKFATELEAHFGRGNVNLRPTSLLLHATGSGDQEGGPWDVRDPRFWHRASFRIYRFRYLTPLEVPAGLGLDTSQLLSYFWEQYLSSPEVYRRRFGGEYDHLAAFDSYEQVSWSPPGEVGMALLTRRNNSEAARHHRVFQRGRWVAVVWGEPARVQTHLPVEIAKLMDRFEQDLNVAYTECVAGRPIPTGQDGAPDWWNKVAEQLRRMGLNPLAILALLFGVPGGLGGLLGPPLGVTLANLGRRRPWWEGDEPSEPSERRGSLDDLPRNIEPLEPTKEPPETEDGTKDPQNGKRTFIPDPQTEPLDPSSSQPPKPVEVPEPTSQNLREAFVPDPQAPEPTTPPPPPEPTGLPVETVDTVETEAEKPGFFERIGERAWNAGAGFVEEMSNVVTDVRREGVVAMTGDTLYNIGIETLQAKNAALRAGGEAIDAADAAVSDVVDDPWILADTFGGTSESMGRGLLAVGDGAVQLASKTAQTASEMYQNPDRFWDALLGAGDAVAAGLETIKNAVTDPDKVVDMVKMVTGIEFFEHSIETDRSLGNRLGQTVMGVVTVGGMLFGARAAGQALEEGSGAFIRGLTKEAVDDIGDVNLGTKPGPTIRPGSPDDFVPAEGVKPSIAGYTEASNRQIQMVADTHGVKIYTRPTNEAAKELLDNGHALPKPELIKNKSIAEIDMDLGVRKTWTTPDGKEISTEGLVGHFEPKLPTRADVPDMTDAQYSKLSQRFEQRSNEYTAQSEWLAKHSDEVHVKDGIIVNNATKLPYTGDVDLFAVRGMNNEPLPKAVVDRIQHELVKNSNGKIQTPADVMHGFHTEWDYSALRNVDAHKFDTARGIDQTIRASHAPRADVLGFEVDAAAPGIGKVTELTGGGDALVTYTAKEGLGTPNPTASYWRGGTGNPLVDPPAGSVTVTGR